MAKNYTLLLLPLSVCFLITSTPPSVLATGTKIGYYATSCPSAELIISDTVATHFEANPTIAAGLLRMHFHDCFVRGCDASVLLEGENTEMTFRANKGLHGFEVVEDAKSRLEESCPGIVSCADILALSARDSVVLTQGPYWEVPTGRRDGRVSRASEAANLPAFNDTVEILVAKFAEKGLTAHDMVTLSGAHTLGKANCQFFSYRLYNFNKSDPSSADPTINSTFLPHLRSRCPLNSNQPPRRVNLDYRTPLKFDNKYFGNLKNGKGLLESDQELWTHPSTRPLVHSFMGHGDFRVEFPKSMIKMGNIGIMAAPSGEVRKVCSKIN